MLRLRSALPYAEASLMDQKSAMPISRPIAGITDCSAVLPAAATSMAVNSSRKLGVDIAVPAIPGRDECERTIVP